MTDKPMTIEQAIRLLDPATMEAAIAEIEYYHGFNGRAAGVQAFSDACELACEIMREHMETKDALAGMDIMLESAESAEETYKRNLSAALNQMRGECRFCRHGDTEYQCNECMDCVRGSSWVWKGISKNTKEA